MDDDMKHLLAEMIDRAEKTIQDLRLIRREIEQMPDGDVFENTEVPDVAAALYDHRIAEIMNAQARLFAEWRGITATARVLKNFLELI